LSRLSRALAASGALAALLLALPASAARYCDAQARLNAEQKDRLFRFGAVIKEELENSGAQLALMSRSGLDLSRFGVRYSHAGISLKASPDTPWAVRQLYFACDEGRPLLFDQGLAAFLMGTDEPGTGYVSVVLLPRADAARIERAALDNRLALQLLNATYSANAYPFSTRYQNCNQWVLELLATAWGQLDSPEAPRLEAQRWLQVRGYEPMVFDIGWRPLMWATAFVPWLHRDDHPDGDLDRQRFRVSMPASIEAFVQAMVPGARRIEFCHNSRQIVVREGWTSITEGCQAAEGDRVVTMLD
jgi:hypothetical protein